MKHIGVVCPSGTKQRGYMTGIPSEIIGPILAREIESYEMRPMNGSGQYWGMDSETKNVRVVCELAARTLELEPESIERKLRRTISGEQGVCDIYFADHIFSALSRHEVWYEKPLSDYYFSDDIILLPEVFKPKKRYRAGWRQVSCANCGVKFSTKSRKKRLCSVTNFHVRATRERHRRVANSYFSEEIIGMAA